MLPSRRVAWQKPERHSTHGTGCLPTWHSMLQQSWLQRGNTATIQPELLYTDMMAKVVATHFTVGKSCFSLVICPHLLTVLLPSSSAQQCWDLFADLRMWGTQVVHLDSRIGPRGAMRVSMEQSCCLISTVAFSTCTRTVHHRLEMLW